MKKNYWKSTFALLLVFIVFYIPWLISKPYSNTSLDAMMTNEEKGKTGLDKLSVTERIELKNWIDKHFILRSTSRVAPSTPEISSLYYNGAYIKLNDGTLWQIHPDDVLFSQAWITPVPIYIEHSKNSTYPFILENSVTKTKVRARKVTSLPQ